MSCNQPHISCSSPWSSGWVREPGSATISGIAPASASPAPRSWNGSASTEAGFAFYEPCAVVAPNQSPNELSSYPLAVR